MKQISQEETRTIYTGWLLIVLSLNFWIVWMPYSVTVPGAAAMNFLLYISFIFADSKDKPEYTNDLL